MRAFTLAEVLITLGIIGVVAAMTIPTLMNNYQKTQTITQYKKAYSEISQALKLAEVDNGSLNSWDFGVFDGTGSRTSNFANQYLYPYLKLSKKCDFSESGCWTDSVTMSNGASSLVVSSATHLNAIVVSGYSIYFWVSSASANVQMYVDINGPSKGKNKIGIDVFGFALQCVSSATQQSGFYPIGIGSIPSLTRDTLVNDSTLGCNKTGTGAYVGAYCAALIQNDGWKISSDYPW